jgi:hypothetical protein
MNYTREQAEQVLKDWDEFHKCSTSLRGRLNKQFLDTKFPTLGTNVWLKHDSGAIIYRTGETSGYGFERWGSWFKETSDWSFNSSPEDWKPANDEEVIEALEKYAKSIGLVEGARVKCLYDGSTEILTGSVLFGDSGLSDGKLWLDSTLSGGSVLVMQHGTWATPIKSDLHKKLEELKKQAQDEGMKLVITFENK